MSNFYYELITCPLLLGYLKTDVKKLSISYLDHYFCLEIIQFQIIAIKKKLTVKPGMHDLHGDVYILAYVLPVGPIHS
jgi:hypothetical protein